MNKERTTTRCYLREKNTRCRKCKQLEPKIIKILDQRGSPKLRMLNNFLTNNHE